MGVAGHTLKFFIGLKWSVSDETNNCKNFRKIFQGEKNEKILNIENFRQKKSKIFYVQNFFNFFTLKNLLKIFAVIICFITYWSFSANKKI